MRLGGLEKKLLLTLLKGGADTVKGLKGFVGGVDRNSVYRALRSLREKGLVVSKLCCVVGSDDGWVKDGWFLTEKRQVPYTQFFVVKIKEEDGGYFHLYGLTVEGKRKAVELRGELLDFKAEWDKFV